jgi:predicted RNA-binding protein Jag
LNFRIFPQKEHKKNARKSSVSKQNEKSQGKNSISSFTKLFRIIVKILSKIWNSTKVSKLSINLSISTGDAASTAIVYGQACSAFYPLLQLLLKNKESKNFQIKIYPNFSSPKTEVKFFTKFRCRLITLLSILVMHFAARNEAVG